MKFSGPVGVPPTWYGESPDGMIQAVFSEIVQMDLLGKSESVWFAGKIQKYAQFGGVVKRFWFKAKTPQACRMVCQRREEEWTK